MGCFFEIHHPHTDADFDGFANLRYADQLTMKKHLGESFHWFRTIRLTFKRKSHGILIWIKFIAKEQPRFSVHYMKRDMKNDDQSCNSCKKLIRTGNLFIVDKNRRNSLHRNEIVYHSHCFARIRSQLNWNQSVETLIGFDKLPIPTQERLKELITWDNSLFVFV